MKQESLLDFMSTETPNEKEQVNLSTLYRTKENKLEPKHMMY